MSPRNLARVFRRATGLTPKQFGARVKVQVARDLLADPQRTIEGIAASCGFEDARQLRRLWKQSFGMSNRRISGGNMVALAAGIAVLIAAPRFTDPPKEPLQVAFVVSENANLMDVAGAWEVFQDTMLQRKEGTGWRQEG
jgi:transcriptional regulator GlxA family with amidase domain